MRKFYALLFVIFWLGIGNGKGQFNELLNFNMTNGANPYGSLIISGSQLFGMTYNGGIHDSGCIFSLDTNGGNNKDLHDFGGKSGAYPYGSLIRYGSKMYGMASWGDAKSYGSIFSIDTNGNQYRDIFFFNDTNGSTPLGSLILSGSTLFGMTNRGGENSSSGVLFSIDTLGNKYKILLDFDSTTGKLPCGSLILSGDTLYGMTSKDGSSGGGMIFYIDTAGKKFKDILDFSSSTGADPVGDLIISGNALFGMTMLGGVWPHFIGNIFRINTNGTAFKTLLVFNDTNGYEPYGSLTLLGNKLYGMTTAGGFIATGAGLIFSLDTDGNGYLKLLDFNSTNALFPHGNLTYSNNSFYGMTYQGGANNDGIVFKIDTDGTTSINELSSNLGSLIVFPNPSSGIFTLQSTVVSNQCSVEVYNVLGEKVFSKFNIQHPTFNIDLSCQSNGIYLYRVLSEDEKMLGEGKVVIQK